MSSEMKSYTVRENAIQTRHGQILDDIYIGYGTSQLNHEGTNALNREWNELSDQREGLHSRSTMDPLLLLPAELWTDIVQETIKGIGTAGPSTDALLLLTLVNSDWRTKLLNVPGLWTDITIGKGEADAQAKLETILWLSQTLHFTLRFNVPPLQWGEALPLLQLHAQRIKRIALTFFPGQEDPDPTKKAEFLHNLFPSLGHLPRLQVIWLYNGPPVTLDWHDMATRAPNLRYLYVPHMSAVPLEIVRRLALRACTIEAQSLEVLQNLGDMSHVEELSWRVDEDTKAYSGICSLPSMPALRHIYSHKILNSNFLLLLKLAGTLTTLEISITNNWKSLYDLFDLFEHLPHLQVLELSLHAISEEVTLPAAMNLCQTCLQDLTISDFRIYEKRSLDALFNLFPIYFPVLRSFDFNFVVWDLPLASCIKSLSNLRSLRLFYISGNFNVSIDSPSLQQLILYAHDEASILSIICNAKCSTLSKLSFSVGGGFEEKVAQSPQESYYPHGNGTSSIYATIETLEIDSIQARWEVPKFTALRKLQVGGHSVRTSGLLVELMLQPCSCPALTDIELISIPEWDLLFLMLEHRNFSSLRHSHSRGIAKIETITLPSPVPRFLLEPLTALLSGERSAISTRPSNWDLSFCGFMEEYFDPTIPGCERCIISMMTCTHPSLKVSRRLDSRRMFHQVYLPPEQSGVPSEAWEWLQSREDRRSAWKAQEDAWIKGRFVRSGMCADMELAQRPFSVTRYSLSGKWLHSRFSGNADSMV